jgi:hypothetical protein
MISWLTFPWALWGLLSIPALLALYFLRRRAQRRVQVSSLFLWAAEKQVQQGGARFERMQRNWLLLLELLLLLLLTLAAAEPRWMQRSYQPPLMVVLDNSYSMQAGGSDSPRSRALAKLKQHIDAAKPSYVRLILAGSRPSLLGGMLTDTSKLGQLLKQWKCLSSSANLEQATGFALQLGGARSRVLVVTDHPPEKRQKQGRIRTWSVGKSRHNIALVQAVRTRQPNGDWVMATVANLSEQTQQVKLTLRLLTPKPSVKETQLSLAAGERRRLTFTLPRSEATIRLELPNDALPLDNRAILLPATLKPIRVTLLLDDEGLKKRVQQAVLATRAVKLVKENAELILTDRSLSTIPPSDAWRVRFLQEKKALAYTGPWVMQRSHPLLKGVSLKGVIWSAGKKTKLPGTPILMAGNIPLLTVLRPDDQQRIVYFRWRSDLSNLTQSPNWPILMWNLIRWRSMQQPGFRAPNTRLDTPVAFSVPAQISQFLIEEPDGTKIRRIKTQNSTLLQARKPGVHRVTAGGAFYAYSVNALSQDESDLRKALAGNWGQWKRDEVSMKRSVSLRWPLLLLAFLLFLLHQYMTRQTSDTQGGKA